ncbi:hypothetical protein [Streptomyces sp. NPDC053720]|uniref:hypothetical protein n=1 Tax=Streptomyces sp. NPDC053720 TaxID=3154855 RepID=UPI00343FC313
MPVVTLLLRRENRSWADGEQTVYVPEPEEVELDDLTPRARALAEAFAQHPLGGALAVVMEKDALIRDTVRHWEQRYPGRGDERPRVIRSEWVLRPVPVPDDLPPGAGWPREGASIARLTAQEWLEREVRRWPLDLYAVGAPGCDPVPGMAAGAADRVLTPDTVLEYLHRAGRPMGIEVWDAMRGTSYLPAPDRIVCGIPQWRPETLAAFIARPVELWPLSRVAEYLGITPGSARVQMRRWRLPAAGRAPGRGGESLYDADQVRALHAARRGRGRHGAPRSTTSGKFTAGTKPLPTGTPTSDPSGPPQGAELHEEARP